MSELFFICLIYLTLENLLLLLGHLLRTIPIVVIESTLTLTLARTTTTSTLSC